MDVFAAPTTETAISEAVADAATQKQPLRIAGGGTRSGIGHPVGTARLLDMSGHSGIVHYEPGSLVLVARAGTPMAVIDAALAAENQMLAFEPMDHRALYGTTGAPTIGGVVAGNVSGPRRFRSGACRDHLLGVRFVDGRGRLIRNGGRVMKNVTGLDLGKLLCGSWGTLGVLSEVALKVLPRPPHSASLRVAGLDEAQAVALFCKALSTPYEVSGAAWQDGVAMLRFEGLEAQVTYRIARMQALFAGHDMAVLEEPLQTRAWVALRDLRPFEGTTETVWKLSVRATDAPAILLQLKRDLPARALLDQGGGTIWLGVASDAAEQAPVIRGALAPRGGHATLIRGSAALRTAVPVFQPVAPRLAALSEGLRQKFDPSGILNPGLMAA